MMQVMLRMLLTWEKDGANDMVAANSTTKDGKDSSTNMTPIQVVEDSQEGVGDDVKVDFVATQVLVTTKRKNWFHEELVMQIYPASTTSEIGVSNSSPLSPIGIGGQLSTGLVVVLDGIKDSVDQFFADQFINQVSTSAHVLPFVFDAEKQVVSKFWRIWLSKTLLVNLRNWRKIMSRLLGSLEGHVNFPLKVSKKPLKQGRLRVNDGFENLE